MEELKLTQREWIRKEAVDCFNGVWDLLDRPERTSDEALQMIHKAHTSRYLWELIGEPVNLARGEWQISRVYATLRLEERSVYHAQKSLEYCEQNGIGDFDLAFAYEALARAYALGDKKEMVKLYREKAFKASQTIASEEDKAYLLSELTSI